MAETFDTILKANYCQKQDLINLFTLLTNRVFGAAGLSIDAAAQDVETDNAFDYCIDGIMYTLAAQDAIDLSGLDAFDADGDALTAIAAQAKAYDQLYVLSVDADGTIIISQSEAVATGGDVPFPTIPSGYVPFGAVKVVNGTAGNFTFGTTELSTAGITDTYYDISVMLPGVEF